MVHRSDDKLCLQWNDFQENLTSAFRDLRDDREFTDVTLACADGQQMEAHKVVLITSSPFFRNLLIRNKHPHPLIYMKGVKSDDLKALIDFVYQGETNVYQENLDSFLAIAEELQLKGLRGDQSEKVPDKNPSKKDARKANKLSEETADLTRKSFRPYPMKGKLNDKLKKEPNPETAVALNSDTAFTDIAELSEAVKSMMMPIMDNNGQNARICNACGKEGSMGALVYHIEANHMTGIALPCNMCGQTFATRNALSQHKIKCRSQ